MASLVPRPADGYVSYLKTDCLKCRPMEGILGGGGSGFVSYRLYFFKYQPEMVHDILLETDFVRAYPKHRDLVPELFVHNIFGN